MKNEQTATPRIKTGIAGLDHILAGGLPHNRLYLVQGDPGVGKTTLALQFMREGARNGERCLYVTLSETRDELEAVATSHGWSLDGIDVYEVSAADQPLHTSDEDENTLYVPAEIELGERMHALLVEVERLKPSRIVLDSCSELRLLAHSPLRFRRQLLALKADLVRRNVTILLLENPTSVGGDPLLQSLVHGVISMEQLSPLYGAERRRLRVAKMREVSFRGGYHDFRIERGGIVVFPRLVAADHHACFEAGLVTSGVAPIDTLLGGGLHRGTSALLVGPAGAGKSALATQYAVAAALRNEHAVIFAFDESIATFLTRSSGVGMDLSGHLSSKRISIHQVDPAELSPGEFVARVRRSVEETKARIVVIDSLNGYLQAMPEEHFLTTHLHELLTYLGQHGVVTLLLVAQHGFLGAGMATPIDVSYLADTVILLRYFEAGGRVRKAISVPKRRAGAHEDAIREFVLGPKGFAVGRPLSRFHGVLTGVPVYDGHSKDMLAREDRD